VIAERIPELATLSSDDKILLAAELWHDAVGSEAETPNPALLVALRERLDHYYAHPEEGSGWDDVRRRILAQRHS
jgi:hypothetical protein